MRGRELGAPRRGERGQTILITAVAMVALLSMAVLAIDVVTLYVASGEAQKAADAAALAGAKVFVTSGFTSGQLGLPSTGAAQNLVCNGTTGLSDLQAQAVANQNRIAGTVPTTVTTSCTFPTAENPQITVVVTRTGLPTFFARIWKAGASSASATAKAEAFNPSGASVPVQVKNVKPWLFPNCDPTAPTLPCPLAYFVSPNTNYALNNPSAYMGKFFSFTQMKPPQVGYYAVGNLTQPTDCPSPSAKPAGSCDEVQTGDIYHDNIACASTLCVTCAVPTTVSCGDTLTIDPNTASGGKNGLRARTYPGTQCLMHTTAQGNPKDSCGSDDDPDCFVSPPVSGLPTVSISGGQSNPNPAMRVANISRSDSVVSVPLFDGSKNPGPSVKVIGFLQLGVQSVSKAGQIGAVVMNAVGCNPFNSGQPASGGGVSPIPVRLVN